MQAKRLAHMFVVATMIVALISLMAPAALAAPPAQAGDSDPNGIVCYYNALGDRVWHDMDGDGCQDEDEPGVDGVTVKLYRSGSSSSISTRTTSGGGYYRFEDLDPNKSYYVRFVKPSGYEFTIQDAGCGDTLDSDADPTTGKTIAVSVPKNVTDLTWDAGLYQPASLGDRVWVDADGDGVQDDGETGLDGVTVNLYTAAGESAGSTTTAGGGLYLFANLKPGRYVVEFVLPDGYAFTAPDQGDDASDSDADQDTGRTAEITLRSGQNDLTWDAGLYRLASLGDRVWLDANRNGIQDVGEVGVEGVTVHLYRSGGVVPEATTVTDANGEYLFTDLVPGDYFVEFDLPAGYAFTAVNQGSDLAADSDADPSTGQTAVTTLVSGEEDLTWDAGLVGVLSLGNLVWNDQDNDSVVDPTDGNGVQDPGEPAFVGVAVWLFSGPCADVDVMADPHLSGTTDDDGFYLFTNLMPGNYCVVIPPSAFQTGGPLAGYDVTQLDAGGDDALDSDAQKSLYPAPEYAYIDAVLTDHDDDTFDFGFVIGNPPTAVTLTALAADSAMPRPWSAVAWGALGIAGMIGLAWRRWGR